MPKWTENQKKTIYTRDKNILVSAAAGSGKTAVLIQRIISLVIDQKTDIDSFLITTFTKAASDEMKQRLEAAIREEMTREGADRTFLRRQLQLLPGAAIGTFHSFAIDIIRQYFYLTDLEPGFQIADEVRTILMKRDAVRQLIDRRYATGEREFLDFLTRHSSDRNDRKLMETITGTYQELRSIPHYMDWADSKIADMIAESPSRTMGLAEYISREAGSVINDAADLYEEAARLLDTPHSQNVFGKAMEDALRIREAAEQADNFGLTADFLEHRNLNTMRATKEEKQVFDPLKEQLTALRKDGKGRLDGLKKKFYEESLEEYDEEIRGSHDDTAYFIGLVKEFENIYRELKKEKACIDFDDVMHYAIDILENDTAAEEQKARFRYIFIDEYQDSNALQETIVGRIAGSNNLFMVGDVKQSIYKFRLAEPEIFMEKAAAFRSEEDENSTVIDLNINFRSKSSVTSAVNSVFEKIMPGYDDKARLYCTCSDEHPGYATGLHLISRSKAEAGAYGMGDREAEIVADIIRDSVGKDIFDSKSGRYRKTDYRDIAVLSRASARVADVERYLNNENIPAYGETDEGYFESVEIQVFINLLRIVDNMQQDIALISVMKSLIFNFSVRELAEIRIHSREGSFHDAVMAYLSAGEKDELKEKIAEMINRIEEWKQLGASVPLDEFMRMLMFDTGYYDYCSGLPVGRQRISNLQLILEKALGFEQTSHEGLHGFLRYVEAMAEGRISEAEAKIVGEGENVVRVMTVHKSKGLEFPVVILLGAGRKIGAGGSSKGASLHKDSGIGLPLVNTGQHWKKKTLLQNVISSRKSREDMDEAVRILYVAMTRAKDRLDIIGTIKDETELSDRAGRNSYIDMTYASLSGKAGVNLHFYKEDETNPQSSAPAGGRLAELLHMSEENGCSDAGREEIARRLGFIYPQTEGSTGRLKYAVTELGGKGGYEIPIAEFEPDPERHSLSAAEIGTLMHLLMEKISFQKAVEEGRDHIESVADRLEAEGSITSEERACINTESISAFFETDMGRRAAEAAKAGKLHREKEFILEKEVEGHMAVVQGIIDCWFEEDDGLVLIDYKNSYIGSDRNTEDIRERYSTQLAVYTEALELATGRPVKEAGLYMFNLKAFI